MAVMDSEKDTRTLVERARGGDRAAFEALVERHRARLEAFVGSRLGSHLQAGIAPEDVVQESLLQAFSSIERFRWEGSDAFMRWLTGIAEHVIRKEARRQGRDLGLRLEPRGDVPVSPISTARAMRRGERFDRLRAAVAGLREDYRQVILLSRIEGLKVREIAARMHRSEGAVRNLLLRALGKLQRSFGDTESLGLPPEASLSEEEGR